MWRWRTDEDLQSLSCPNNRMAYREPSSTLDRAEETEDEDTYDEGDDYVPVSPRKNLKVNRKPRSSSGSPRYDVDVSMSRLNGMSEAIKHLSLCWGDGSKVNNKNLQSSSGSTRCRRSQ